MFVIALSQVSVFSTWDGNVVAPDSRDFNSARTSADVLRVFEERNEPTKNGVSDAAITPSRSLALNALRNVRAAASSSPVRSDDPSALIWAAARPRAEPTRNRRTSVRIAGLRTKAWICRWERVGRETG